MTPYRSALIEGRVADPARARFGLAGAAVGSLACFVALIDMVWRGWGRLDNVLLFGGSAAIALLLAYSAVDAPAGRSVLVASIAAFAISFVPQVAWPELMGTWVWSARYLALAGIAAGLLLRLRRTRPGKYGALLRLAGIVALWWGVYRLAAPLWRDTNHTLRSELFSRVVYLLLAGGIVDMRRWVGAVPAREPVRTPIDSAREIATTRLCLAVVSIGAALTTRTYTWQSEWAVIAAAEAASIGITLALHLPWLLREQANLAAVVVAFASAIGLTLAWVAFDVRPFAALAAISCAVAALAADIAVFRFAAATTDSGARPAFKLSVDAIALHVVNAGIIVFRVLEA